MVDKMSLRAFSRHKLEQELDFRDKYRRLRILYNRTMLYSDRPFYYSYWAKHTYQTNLGPRTFVCTTINKNTEDEYYEFYYEKPVETEDGEKIGIVLFKIQINKKWYKFDGFSMNEEQAWLAIHELEELSYKELELYETV